MSPHTGRHGIIGGMLIPGFEKSENCFTLLKCEYILNLTWIISTINARRARNKRRQDTVDEKRRGELIANIAHLKASKKRSDSLERTDDFQRLALEGKNADILTLLYIPMSIILSFVGIPGSFLAQNRNSSTLELEQFFLTAQSVVSMSSLDQIAALVGGVIVLLAAIRSAYRSRGDSKGISTSIKRRQSI